MSILNRLQETAKKAEQAQQAQTTAPQPRHTSPMRRQYIDSPVTVSNTLNESVRRNNEVLMRYGLAPLTHWDNKSHLIYAIAPNFNKPSRPYALKAIAIGPDGTPHLASASAFDHRTPPSAYAAMIEDYYARRGMHFHTTELTLDDDETGFTEALNTGTQSYSLLVSRYHDSFMVHYFNGKDLALGQWFDIEADQLGTHLDDQMRSLTDLLQTQLDTSRANMRLTYIGDICEVKA